MKADWAKIKADFKPYKVLEKTSNIDIIQAITIFATYKRRKSHELKGETENLTTVSAKLKEMLNLSLSDYINYRDQIVSGLLKHQRFWLKTTFSVLVISLTVPNWYRRHQYWQGLVMKLRALG